MERERGRHSLAPIFNLVYATPLLQHQAQIGLNPTLNVVDCRFDSTAFRGYRIKGRTMYELLCVYFCDDVFLLKCWLQCRKDAVLLQMT